MSHRTVENGTGNGGADPIAVESHFVGLELQSSELFAGA